MTNLELARWYAALLGVGLVVGGLAAFVDNPIVGHPVPAAPVFHVGGAHAIVLVAAGALSLVLGFGLSGAGLVNGVMAVGGGFVGMFALTLLSPTLFGFFDVGVNLADHVLHAGLGVVSLAVAWLARQPRKQPVVAS